MILENFSKSFAIFFETDNPNVILTLDRTLAPIKTVTSRPLYATSKTQPPACIT